MQQFMSRQQPPARPTGNLGTSGIFSVQDLSPSINPTNIDGSTMLWKEVLPGMAKPDRVRGLAVDGLEAIRKQALAAQHATRQIHSDRTLGEAERHRRSATSSADLIKAAQPVVEHALGAVRKSIEELTATLAGPAIELSDAAAIEIRTQLAGLPKDKRMAAISRSIAKNSDRVVAALLGAGADRFLSEGIVSDLELEMVRTQWALARHPDEVQLLKLRKTDLAYLERASTLSMSWQAKTHNPAIVAAPSQPVVTRGTGPSPVNHATAPGLEQRAAAFKAMYG